jgi:hypothetical protein
MEPQSRVDRLFQLAEALERGQTHPVTRLTIIKPLCEEAQAARRFSLYGAAAAVKLLPRSAFKPSAERTLAESTRTLLAAAVRRRSPLGRIAGTTLLEALVAFQPDHLRVPFGVARVIRSRALFVSENALRLAIAESPLERGRRGYQLAVSLTRGYDSRYGDGLIPASRSRMHSLAEFFATMSAPNTSLQRTRYARR